MSKARPRRVEMKGHFLVIDGDYYIAQVNEDGDFDTGAFKFRRIEREKIDKMVKTIAEKLKGSLDPEIVLKDALMELPEKDLKKLTLKLVKEKPKITVRKHCVQMKVGGVKIYIR
jgi:hypothetical protein